MAVQALPINRLVKVDVNLAPRAASTQNISTLLILGTSGIIDTVERYRLYNTIDQVATDFGVDSPEYLAAVLYFEQSPQPGELLIGQWQKDPAAAKIVGASLSTAQQDIAIWNAVTTPTFAVTMDGVPYDVSVGSFAAETNLNGIASLIQTALEAIIPGTTCVWDLSYNRFVITSGTTGSLSTISFLSGAPTGIDISELLGMTTDSSGSYLSQGADSETAIEAVTLYDTLFGQTWYALTIIGATNDDHVNVANYIEATTNKHFYVVSTQEAGVLVSTDTTNVAYLLKQLGLNKTAVQYSSSNPYSGVSLIARILTTDYQGNNTVITLMYKQEPGIIAEVLNPSQINALESFNCNVFVAYRNDTAIIEKGTVVSGDFIDTIIGADWLALEVQTAVYNLLYTATTKIPQTNAGNHLIATTIEGVLAQGVVNGLIAPGIWTVGGFGTLKQNDFLPKGYYVYYPPIETQKQADREARKSVLFQCAVKLAGAIHTVDIQINVNR